MNKENNKDRNKLTLKLKAPNISSSQITTLKNSENKKISNSLVQVSIKKRRLNTKNTTEEPSSTHNNTTKESRTPEPKNKDTEDSNHNNSYNTDNLNVRNKIKASIEVEQKSKASAQNTTKINTEEAKSPKIEKNKYTKGKSKNKNNYEESSNNTKYKDFKNKRSSRSLKTFVVSDRASQYNKRRSKAQPAQEGKEKEYAKISKEVTLPEFISVSDLSVRMTEKTSEVIKKLFAMGLVATSNQVIDADTAELIIEEFGHKAKRVSESDVESILNNNDNNNIEKIARAPIVTIMGHVDHGKTSLLDSIRSTNVTNSESGGITQHIGASRIKTKNGNFITFLDTPGHEAFTNMRSRGANLTDIIILVVAADDGVKQQTIEAINHAKSANVPIIVAVNKIDKTGADPNKVKNELLSYNIVAEDLSGDTIFVEVSAIQKTNLNQLLEAILLQAEILELKAPYDAKAKGSVIETEVDPAKGVLATLLIQEGTLKISDIIVAGTAYGKVKRITNDKGGATKEATPSVPVKILGLDSPPNAGDQFFTVEDEKSARNIVNFRLKKEREKKGIQQNTAKPISDIFKQTGDKKTKLLSIIIKGDVHGSVEAICNSLLKLNNDEVAIKITHSAVGGINESDVSLAEVSNAIIIGFNVRANNITKGIAENKNVEIRYHSIIYNVIDEIKLLLSGMLDTIKREETLGQAEIREIFKISNFGKIAGCFVTEGLVRRDAKARLLRDSTVIFDGRLKTLRRFKDDVKEVKNNFECGIAFDNYEDIKTGDLIECYSIVEEKRTLD